jgi:hypothetical protein
MMRGMLGLAILSIVGCSGGTTTATISPPATIAGTPTVNKEFQSWTAFPVGSTVVTTAITKAGDTTMTSVETLRLVETTPEQVRVERQNTTVRSDMTEKAVNPPEMRTHAKSFLRPDSLSAEDYAKPSLKAKLIGPDQLTILGREFACDKYQWIDMTDKGPMTITLWLSKDVPGGRAKQTMVADQAGMTTAEEITSLVIPGQK